MSRLTLVGLVAALPAAMLAGGCGGGDDGDSLEGIYAVSAWTKNGASCATEGASILAAADQTTFYIKREHLLGVAFLNVAFCDGVTECDALRSDSSTIHVGRFAFDGRDEQGGWTSALFTGYRDSADLCVGDWTEATLAASVDGGVRIEVRVTPVEGFAPDGDGTCGDDVAGAAAAGQPCGSFEVITAVPAGG